MTRVTISMTDSLKVFLEEEREARGFDDVSGYIQSLLTEAQARTGDAHLESLLMEGMGAGEDIPLTPLFWDGINAEATGIVAKHRDAQR